jgi:hypothetical protein
MWDLWWTKWHWDSYFSEFFGFPLSIHHSTVDLQTYIWEMRNMLAERQASTLGSDPPPPPRKRNDCGSEEMLSHSFVFLQGIIRR